MLSNWNTHLTSEIDHKKCTLAGLVLGHYFYCFQLVIHSQLAWCLKNMHTEQILVSLHVIAVWFMKIKIARDRKIVYQSLICDCLSEIQPSSHFRFYQVNDS